MQTTITKWGNSQGIRLPKHLFKRANLKLRLVNPNDSLFELIDKDPTREIYWA